MTRRRIFRLVQAFRASRDGTAAVIFSLSLIPIIGCIGAAVDYSMAVQTQSEIQKDIDAYALAIVKGTPLQDLSAAAEADLTRKYGAKVKGITFTADWISPTDAEIVASADVKTSIMAVIGIPTVPLKAAAIARNNVTYTTATPTTVQLDPEAADYDQMYVYCYDPLHTTGDGRSQMTLMADNGGSTIVYTMPSCKQGENISFRLHDIRNARSNPRLWTSSTAEQYNYYSDTSISSAGVQSMDFGGESILETVLCDTLSVCKTRSKGGIIPEGKNRVPQKATAACASGKYMYYGWEDRPPSGSSDRDYDDIRVIVSCPSILASDKTVRLVR